MWWSLGLRYCVSWSAPDEGCLSQSGEYTGFCSHQPSCSCQRLLSDAFDHMQWASGYTNPALKRQLISAWKLLQVSHKHHTHAQRARGIMFTSYTELNSQLTRRPAGLGHPAAWHAVSNMLKCCLRSGLLSCLNCWSGHPLILCSNSKNCLSQRLLMCRPRLRCQQQLHPPTFEASIQLPCLEHIRYEPEIYASIPYLIALKQDQSLASGGRCTLRMLFHCLCKSVNLLRLVQAVGR